MKKQQKWVVFCVVTVVKTVVIFLKNTQKSVCQEELFKKKDAFSESL